MNEVPLSLENLQQLDFGKIGAAFNAELTHVVKDCMDRPHDEKSRKVQICFLIAPAEANMTDGPGETLDVGCEITSAVPKRRTQIYSMKPRVNGSLTFHPDLPKDPTGSTLYDSDERVNKDTGEVG